MQGLDYVKNCMISIHAPARGATRIVWLEKSVTVISIHAPARGATVLLDFI